MAGMFRSIMLLRKKMRDQRWNLFGLLLGIILWFYGAWQLDELAAPYVWANAHIREILPFWFWPSTWAYVLFFTWLTLGYLISIASLLLIFRRIRFIALKQGT
jgi:hypothetical protein